MKKLEGFTVKRKYRVGMQTKEVLNWAHRSVDKHTTHKVDHTIYSVIEEWNNAKMAATVIAFINKKGN